MNAIIFLCIYLNVLKGENIMREILEKLWNEYFAEECAVIDTEEERTLIRKAAEMHQKANELLTKEQSDALENALKHYTKLKVFVLKRHFSKE